MQPSAGSIENRPRKFEPVRIAILDSGFDPKHPLLITDHNRLDPRIKGVHNFVHGAEPWDIQDEIGHGTHALGLLLKVATCAEIYIARVANKETLGRDSYDAIAKARLTHNKSSIILGMLIDPTGDQSRSHRMECGHYIDVIWNP